MKKRIFTLMFALVAMAMTANAQFVAGGTVGFGHNGNKIGDDYLTNSSTTFNINPRLGYQINERMQAGLLLNWAYNYQRTYILGDEDNYTSNHNSTFGLAPYFRYNFIHNDRLNFYLEAAFAMDFTGKGKAYNSVTDASTDGTIKSNQFALRVVPGVNYALTNHLSMDVNFDVLTCALRWNNTENTTTDTKTHSHTYNIKDNGEVISFGFAYTF